MGFIGRLVDIGIGKETTRGTAVAANVWYPRLSGDIDSRVEVVDNESALGTLEDAAESEVTQEYSEISLEGKVRTLGYGYILLSLFGSVDTDDVSGDTSVKDHVFSLAHNNTHPTLTFVEKSPIATLAYPGAVMDSHEVNFNAGEYLQFTADYVARYPETTTATPAHADETEFVGRHITVKLAANVAGLDAASAVGKVRSASISFSKNAERAMALGSNGPEDIYNLQFAVDGEIEIVWEAETYREAMRNGTMQALRISAVNDAVTIGTTSNPSLTFDFPKISMREVSRDMGNNDIVTQTISFKALRDSTAGYMAQATLRNTQASY